ncbi:conserved hypothetical protein [Methanocaldococcus sp. FS406-22]|uniref:hypothetical protein n=1 Tax=Methanocaldococcus sp. (strain FS406-22) TaxID=644281 RepID=UPI0001BF57A9|nr:hypothetical protein [Methanocaldococcus sp. FS406-22]ADC68951.1 conserved hypothetical protein [Methanocaldococcus sp. FS406-22]
MMKRFALFFVFLALITPTFADVEEITNYNMTVDLTKNPAHITNIITIQNLVKYPLVPGIGELRLQKEEPKKILFIPIPFTGEKKPIKIENLKGYYIIGHQKYPMNVSVSYKDTYSVIEYQIWDPIDSGKNITLIIEYDADIVDNGILFKTVSIPVGCDLNIRKFNINFISPYHLTYQEPDGNGFQIPKNTLFIVKAEFSILPLPKLPTYGYVLFWLSILSVLVIIFVYTELRRRNKGNKDNNG